ncbi:ABC transporter permease [Synergistales bacterium]|nr:ABC transporter permease [Synergistales bacterium]
MEKETRPLVLLWGISRESGFLYVISLCAMFAAVFCNFLLPWTIRFVVDSIIGVPGKIDFSLLGVNLDAAFAENDLLIAVFVIGVAIVGGVFSLASQKTLSMAAEGFIKRLRVALFSRIQMLPYSWHIGIQTGDIIQRCTSDVDIIRNFVATQSVEVVRAAVLIVFAYSVLFGVNTALSFVSLFFIAVIFVCSLIFLRTLSPGYLEADEAEGRLLSIAQENFTGVRVVRAFGGERREAGKFDAQNRAFADIWIRLGRRLSVYWGLGDLLTGLQMVAICAAGVYEAMHSRLTPGEFVLFLSYNSMIIWPVRGLGRLLSEAGKAGASCSRIGEILNAPIEREEPDALDILPDGDIEFDNVSFSYDKDHPVLRGVSFTVKRGSTLGILGSTGSGKSTIAHLLCRLHDLEEGNGTIRIGGRDIKRFKRACLRANIGVVLQEPFLFSRTIKENIASLRDGYSISEIKAAAAQAHVDESIEGFADGYDSLIGERGVTLSGGQKGRVAMARALLKSTPILIFDDSLSAVDADTDAKIRSNLRSRLKDVSAIIISHRIASLSEADFVVVLEDGRVAETGAPSELMSKGGVYRRVSDLQSGAAVG